MIHNLAFQCPRCGGSAFGSSAEDEDPKAPLHRWCHGLVGSRNCGFHWRETEDWKYFLVDGKKVSWDEYEEAMKKIRETPAYGTGEMNP